MTSDRPKSRDELIADLKRQWEEELQRLPDETDEEYERRADTVYADPELQALTLLALVSPSSEDQAGSPATNPAPDTQGSDEIRYTAEEKEAMSEALADFHGVKVDPAHADRIHRSICARALWHYAFDRLSDVLEDERLHPGKPDQEELRAVSLEKARPALEKAYAIYPLPLYLYDLAGVAELEGDPEEALDLYRRFLDEQRAFCPDDIDRGLLLERDVAASLKDAALRMQTLAGALGEPQAEVKRPWWRFW